MYEGWGFYKALLISGMDDLFLKRVLFECIRGSLERTDACLDIFTGRDSVMMLNLLFLYKASVLSLRTLMHEFYPPLA